MNNYYEHNLSTHPGNIFQVLTHMSLSVKEELFSVSLVDKDI